MNTNQSNIKKFEDVQIGDNAYDLEFFQLQGTILAKGSWKELEEKYQSTCTSEELEDFGMEKEFLNKCVAISQNPDNTLEGYTSLIYLYNFDCGSICCLISEI